MNQEQLADRIKNTVNEKVYMGKLTSYAVQSILSGRSSYPVQNLITYCKDMNLDLVLTDLATEDRFYPATVLEVHKVLDLLMRRYLVDYKIVYRKTGIHYTAPKSFDPEDLKRIKEEKRSKKPTASLSIKTLLAVCEVIHCDVTLVAK